MNNVVSSEHLASLHENGYYILPGVFDAATVAKVDASLQKFYEDRKRSLAEEKTQGISRAGEIMFESHLAERDATLRAFVTNPVLKEITTSALGPDVDLYWNQIVYKEPEGHREFPWHQDDAYTRVEPWPYLTVWIAVTDATLENGCVSVLPGSYKRGFIPHEETPIGWAGHRADDPDQGVPVPVPAGSAVVFWSTTLHKSSPNRSNGIRKAYVVQYCKAGTTYMENGNPVPTEVPVARGGQ